MRVYEVIETTTRIYIITEYLSGGQLFEKLSKAPKITEKIAAKYMFDIILALYVCHKKGLYHRDIKPENLLFESDAPDAHLKMIDFSISDLNISNIEALKSSIGAVGYTAPERFSGMTSDKNDIWSVGIIMYVIFTGRTPFSAKTDAESIKKVLVKQVFVGGKAWEGISVELKNLMQKMLNKDPRLRPTAEEILMDPWFYAYTKNTISDSSLNPETTSILDKFHVGFK